MKTGRAEKKSIALDRFDSFELCSDFEKLPG
jgi:hypothetical protein